MQNATRFSRIFGTGFAFREVGHGAPGFLGLIEHRVNLIDDWGFNAELSGKLVGGTGGGVTLGRRGRSYNPLEFFPAADAFAESAVAAEARIAGGGEIAEAAEAGEGFGAGADRDSKAANFHNTPRDQSG